MSNTINVRESAAKYIKTYDSRILELGPLNRCLLNREKYKNYFFGDIRSTEEIRELYKGNEYLEKTGLEVDIDSIINIDFVINSTYKETFKGIEKFDYIIVSHVLEHIPNMLFFFKDIQSILKPGGEIIIIYPDRRFCFDALRFDSSFSDIYDTYVNGGKNMARRVLDFFTNVLNENNAKTLWENHRRLFLFETEKDYKKNIEIYKEVSVGKIQEDIHYWPFSDYAFLRFLHEATRYGFLPFSLKKFLPTQFNTQEFLVILKYMSSSEDEKFHKYMKEAIESFNINSNRVLEMEKQSLLSNIEEKEKAIEEGSDIIKAQEVKLIIQKNLIDNMENSKSWKMTKPLRIIRKGVISVFKNGFFFTITKVITKLINIKRRKQ